MPFQLRWYAFISHITPQLILMPPHWLPPLLPAMACLLPLLMLITLANIATDGHMDSCHCHWYATPLATLTLLAAGCRRFRHATPAIGDAFCRHCWVFHSCWLPHSHCDAAFSLAADDADMRLHSWAMPLLFSLLRWLRVDGFQLAGLITDSCFRWYIYCHYCRHSQLSLLRRQLRWLLRHFRSFSFTIAMATPCCHMLTCRHAFRYWSLISHWLLLIIAIIIAMLSYWHISITPPCLSPPAAMPLLIGCTCRYMIRAFFSLIASYFVITSSMPPFIDYAIDYCYHYHFHYYFLSSFSFFITSPLLISSCFRLAITLAFITLLILFISLLPLRFTYVSLFITLIILRHFIDYVTLLLLPLSLRYYYWYYIVAILIIILMSLIIATAAMITHYWPLRYCYATLPLAEYWYAAITPLIFLLSLIRRYWLIHCWLRHRCFSLAS